MRLLDHLAKFKFSLYYTKGKDIIVDIIDIIVIAPRNEKFNSLVNTFCIATRNTTKDKGISLPEVHGARKGVDPAFKPEHQHKSKKVLAKPLMQSQPQTTGVSNTQVAGNKILKRSVKFLSHIQISNTVVGYCWHVVKPFIAVLMLYSSGGAVCSGVLVLWGSTLYWMGMDVHGPCYGWSMCQASAMLLVPDIPLTDQKQ